MNFEGKGTYLDVEAIFKTALISGLATGFRKNSRLSKARCVLRKVQNFISIKVNSLSNFVIKYIF